MRIDFASAHGARECARERGRAARAGANPMNPDSAARLLETAFQLAELGRGSVEPNPRVGALALARGRVVGRGFHAEYGGPHAEIAALEDANKTGQKPDGLLVTLEPCSTAGKTPPAPRRSRAPGSDGWDSAPSIPIPIMRGAGSRACATTASRWRISRGRALPRAEPAVPAGARASRPWVVAKWAMTLDGRTALSNGDSKWVSGEESRARVHRLRGRCEGWRSG